MVNSLPFYLLSDNYNIQEVYNKLNDEMIGYIFLSRPGFVEVVNLRLVPIKNTSDINLDAKTLSSSSQNAASENSEEIEKEIIDDHGNKVEELHITKMKTFNRDKLLEYPSIYTDNEVMSAPLLKSLEISPDLSYLMKPVEEGWKRECAITEDKVTRVYYLSPTDGEGMSKRLSTKRLILDNLGPNTQLSSENFTFAERVLGLPSDFEIVRRSLHHISSRSATFKDYFIDCERNTAKGKRLVECRLCSRKVTYLTFSVHMRKYHLPDEICPSCSVELPPLQMPMHTRTAHMSNIRRGVIVPVASKKVADMTDSYVKSSSQVSPSITEVKDLYSTDCVTSSFPVKDNVDSILSETFNLDNSRNSTVNQCTAISSPAKSPSNVSSFPVVSKNLVGKLRDHKSVDDCLPSVKEELINKVSGSIVKAGLQEPDEKNVNSSGPLNTCCQPFRSSRRDNVVLTFVCSDPIVKKKVQIAGNKPVSKAVRKFSKAIGLSIEDFTYNCEHCSLSGKELTADLPSFVIVMEKK